MVLSRRHGGFWCDAHERSLQRAQVVAASDERWERGGRPTTRRIMDRPRSVLTETHYCHDSTATTLDQPSPQWVPSKDTHSTLRPRQFESDALRLGCVRDRTTASLLHISCFLWLQCQTAVITGEVEKKELCSLPPKTVPDGTSFPPPWFVAHDVKRNSGTTLPQHVITSK